MEDTTYSKQIRTRDILKYSKYHILFTTSVIVGSGFLWLSVAEPIYTAKTSLLLEPKKSSVIDVASAQAGIGVDGGYIESEVAVIGSGVVAKKVIQKLNLEKDSEFSTKKDILPNFIKKWTSISESDNFKNDVQNIITLNNLTKNISVRRIGLTYVIDISASSVSAKKAQDISQEIAQTYLENRRNLRSQQARSNSQWLNNRLLDLTQQLDKDERAAAKFRIEKGLVQTNTGTVDKQQIADIGNQLTNAIAATTSAKARYQESLKGGNSTDTLISGTLSSLRSQESEAGRKASEMNSRYGSDHPLYKSAAQELSGIKSTIRAETERARNALKIDLSVAESKEKSLRENLKELSGTAEIAEVSSIDLRQLDRTASASRLIYESFLNQLKQSQEQSLLEINESRVITAAEIPLSASYPRPFQTIMLALIGGLLAGISLAFGRWSWKD